MINSLMLVGRVGADPEMKYFESGKIKTTFNLAVNRPAKDAPTDWWRVELWGKQAEVAGEYVRKGSLVGIEGRLDFDRYTNKDGKPDVMIKCSASALRLLGSKKDNEESNDTANGGGGGEFR